ncbi:type II secretion system F family protein [Jannaschia seohaensis]|uniref:Tight adherence protein B n=1 Tax=Jannaschia seohaensis TaxID=475081 RepID=A0A2Y9APH2_9RHOB|nr:type II secretion system F family protein [Jannaschia seohaensis]PWJ20301.1 tight adherence protein B [Jannaschia seohaensis]SSA44327.1 tight adherence protein B [Jannaschia seohaensis]
MLEDLLGGLDGVITPDNYAIFAGVFLGLLLFVTGLMQLIQRGETNEEAKNRRMRMIVEGKRAPELLAVLKPEIKQRAFLGLPFLSTLPRDLNQAGMIVKPGRFLSFCLLSAAAATVIAMGFVSIERAVLIGIALGLALPIAYVRRKRNKRLEALITQLPDALDLMSRGLSVGHPLNTTIGSVAKDMPDPIGTEFGIIFDQVSFGDDLTDAVQDFADRLDLEDVHYLSASIGIQHGTGGDLARVTKLLGETIRNRIAMRRRIHAISSEGRMTAKFLSGLPVGIFAFSMLTMPDHFGGVMDSELFPIFAGIVIALTVINYLVLRHLVNFRI